MRPIRLEVEGFTSFADRTVVDFGDLQLFAVTGPTGAGKSSLLDAMLLALFGKVPRVGTRHKQLVTDGRDQVSVMLEFSAAGERYRIARRIRQKGAAQAQLERKTDDGYEPLADRIVDISREMERILGIGYDAFTRAVVLPQGKFDAFLKGEPAERRELLTHLLGLGIYRRMAELANERHREESTRARAIAEQLERDFADAVPERHAELQEQLRRAEAEQQQLAERAELVTRAEKIGLELRRQRAASTTARQARAALEKQLAAARETLRAESAAAESFAEQRSGLEARIAELPQPGVRTAELARASAFASQVRQAMRQVPKLDAEAQRAVKNRERAEHEIRAAEQALPDLQQQAKKLAAEVERAAAATEQAQRDHAAGHLRSQLEKGKPCPVCRQTVERIPRGKSTAVDTARKAHEKALQSATAAEHRMRDVQRLLESLRKGTPDLIAVSDSAVARREEAVQTLAELERELVATGIAIPEPLDPMTLKADIDRQLAEIQKIERQRKQLTAKLQQLVEDHRERQERLAAGTARIEVLTPQYESLAGAEDRAVHAAREAAERLRDACRGIDAPTPPQRDGDPDEATQLEQQNQRMRTAVASSGRLVGQLSQQVEQIARAIGRAAELREELATLTASSALTKDLAQLLQADRFQTFVQEEALHLLTEDGSKRLLTLSQGRYSMRYSDSDFSVVDHWNADRERSVKTLSGGETFLASLALSLGLAERIAALAAGSGKAATLECLFVDEGFGALDPDALEVAVQALEALHGDDRMVGVVTHLPELADRLPARLTVVNQAGRARVVLS